jgi:hypothetical protein
MGASWRTLARIGLVEAAMLGEDHNAQIALMFI